MDACLLSDLSPAARHVVHNLDRVLPRDEDDRVPVVWILGHTDQPARLASEPAELRRRFPADRFAVTVVVPSAAVVPWPCADIRPLLAGLRILDISDRPFVAQMRALAGCPFDVDLGGRRFVYLERRHFLSDRMADLFLQEDAIDYRHPGDLQVQHVPGGVIHPLALSATGQVENAQYGGVTDPALDFVALSETVRINARRYTEPMRRWYVGADPACRPAQIDYVDEDVVFLGAFSKHYGHFILEGLARLWFFLDPAVARHFKAAYISEPGVDRFNDVFTFFGLPAENLIRVTRPTAFRTVVVPEQALRIQDRCHPLYKDTIDRIKLRIPPAGHRKVYFSKEMRQNYRGIGEKPMEDVFVRNGYHLCYPEKMSMFETLSVLKGCEQFAASSGTNAHNAVFLDDGAHSICLNRSPHVHPVQTMIDRLKGLDATYVEANVSLLPADWSMGPFLFGPTRHLMDYFDYAGLAYSAAALQQDFPKYLAEFVRIWGHFFIDERRRPQLEAAEQTVPFEHLVASVADTFIHPPALTAAFGLPPPQRRAA